MESIYHVIVTLMRKLRRRLVLNFLDFGKAFDWAIFINYIMFIKFEPQAMAEKIERMELDSESKDKVRWQSGRFYF